MSIEHPDWYRIRTVVQNSIRLSVEQNAHLSDNLATKKIIEEAVMMGLRSLVESEPLKQDVEPVDTKPSPPPDFDAMSDAEVVAWADGFRPKNAIWWVEPHHGWYVGKAGLPHVIHFDDCLTALDAVFKAGWWSLERETNGYRIESDDVYALPAPTPTAAAVAAIRQAMKERKA